MNDFLRVALNTHGGLALGNQLNKVKASLPITVQSGK
jgi:hypothetical protein